MNCLAGFLLWLASVLFILRLFNATGDNGDDE
jgi:hypothetical protein